MCTRVRGKSALIIPRGSSSDRPETGNVDVEIEKGGLRFNTSTSAIGNTIGMEFWNGTKWVPVNAPPVGGTYLQWIVDVGGSWYDNKPANLWPNTNWTAGDMPNGVFIRNSGGQAKTWNFSAADRQNQMLMTHEHEIYHPNAGSFYRRAGQGDTSRFQCGFGYWSSEPKFTDSDITAQDWEGLTKQKGIENRPDNVTVKFWRRTS